MSIEKILIPIGIVAGTVTAIFGALKAWAAYKQSSHVPISILPLDHKPRILIIDDDAKDLEQCRLTLNGGYEVHTYRRPFEALAKIAAEYDRGDVFDLVILDYVMEPISGPAIAETIKLWQRGMEKRSKIVFFTRMGKMIDKPPGVTAVWRKHEDTLILAEKVREVLGQ